MRTFIDYLQKENIVEKTIEIYKNQITKSDKVLLEKIIKNLFSFQENFTKPSNFDILGTIYEKTLNHKKRKSLGEFYTPFSIVDYILNAIGFNSVNNIDNKKLIDISCGSGSFLIQAIKIFVDNLRKFYNRDSISDLTIEEAKEIIHKVKNNILGIDINPIACILCQINIHFALFNLFKKIRKIEESYDLPQFNIRNMNALNLVENNIYSYVVGNPPYLFIRDISSEHRKIIENNDFETNDGQYDYYQIFIELGLKLLNNHGKLGYIVPDTLLALSNRSILRKYIYNKTKIKEIYYTGPKFDDPVVSNIILSLEKESDTSEREQNYIKIKLSNQEEKLILQENLKKWGFRFLIHLSDTDIPIIEHLNNNFLKLKDLNQDKGYKISLSRGVELAKTGEIIYCESCELYYPVPKKHLLCPECKAQLKIENIEHIIQETLPKGKENDFKKFLFSINRYKIKEDRYIDMSKEGINYKDLEFYEDRIIIRQLSQNSLICATYDMNLSLTSQSFYNLKIVQSPIAEFNHLYLLGVINSKLLSYYFIKCFGSYKKLFPRILIEKIKDLPIKVPESNNEKKIAITIAEKVQLLLENADKSEIQNQIDNLIFEIYNISDKNKEPICEFMEKLKS